MRRIKVWMFAKWARKALEQLSHASEERDASRRLITRADDDLRDMKADLAAVLPQAG